MHHAEGDAIGFPVLQIKQAVSKCGPVALVYRVPSQRTGLGVPSAHVFPSLGLGSVRSVRDFSCLRVVGVLEAICGACMYHIDRCSTTRIAGMARLYYVVVVARRGYFSPSLCSSPRSGYSYCPIWGHSRGGFPGKGRGRRGGQWSGRWCMGGRRRLSRSHQGRWGI